MKPTIWIFSLEPLETRYTAQWHSHIPALLQSRLGDKFTIVQVDGVQKNSQLTPGAFLNFSDTNYWKSSQLCNFLDYHNRGETSTNDHFIFTDAWNPTVIQLKYMSDLLGFDWTLHGMWHAGSYDKEDFLGRIVGDSPWVKHAEKSFFSSYDHNYFATDFHIDLFAVNLLNYVETNRDRYSHTISKKIIKTGWPMEYMTDTLTRYKGMTKRNLILFPHRIAPEKQVEIFRDLATHLPQYEFIVCQDQQLTKDEYHSLLGQAKMVFSANLQETLGISTCSEGPLAYAVPFAPDRLSYSEIFNNHREFLYPSDWTKDWDYYLINRKALIGQIKDIMSNYDEMILKIADYLDTDYKKYFHAEELINQFL